MKKLLFAVVLGLLLVAAVATIASADNGPHGSFTATTEACASCHRAHSAQFGSNALLVMDPEALCLSCHDGTGAGTNVEDGVYSQSGADTYYGGGTVEGTDGASLFGGGFANALMATAWSGKQTADPAFDATSSATTSAHSADGSLGTVWGSGANNSANATYALECVSCHNPHGTAGFTNATASTTMCNPALVATDPCNEPVASYRLLRWQPSGSSGFTAPVTSVNWSGGAFPTNGSTTGWTVPDNFAAIGTEWYTIGTTNAFAVGDYNAGNANDAYNPPAHNYRPAGVNVAFFCAQCHDRYFNNTRLRNATDASAYCGSPVAGTVVNGTTLTQYAPVLNAGTGFYEHPVDPARCLPQGSALTAAGITAWGDNGASGDTVYAYRHNSGDVRAAMDGTVAAGAGTSISRSCVACHVSHGTSASMTAFASDASLATGSTLLRMDNRSLCLRCHDDDVGFVTGP